MPTTLKDALKAKILGSELLGQGIYGIGICESECPTHPDYDGVSSIHIYSNKRARIPSRILDVEVEHVLTHRIRTFAIQGGASVSNTFCACAGTLGAQVFDAIDGTPLLLSNAHVLCLDQRSNWVSNLKGIPIVSPSVYDGGTSANTIGNVLRWASLNSYSAALADWAVANMVSSTVTTGISQIGAISGIQDFVIGDKVEIFGRTSGFMQGTVADSDALVSVDGYGFGCYDEETRTLTDNGLKYWYEIGDEDKIAQFEPSTGVISFVKPLSRTIYKYKGKMLHIKTRTQDLLVTPNHKCLYRKPWEDNWNIIQAEEFLSLPQKSVLYVPYRADWIGAEINEFVLEADYPSYYHFNKEIYDYVVTSGHSQLITHSQIVADTQLRFGKSPSRPTVTAWINGESRKYDQSNIFDKKTIVMDDWLEFVGYLVSEGSLLHNKDGLIVGVSISQRESVNHAKVEKIRKCVANMPFHSKEYMNPKTTQVKWTITNKQMGNWYAQNIGHYSNDKCIPRQFLCLSVRQLRILFEALMLGDGSWSKKFITFGTYMSTSSKIVDGFLELCVKLGFSTGLSVQKRDLPQHDCYVITVITRPRKRLVIAEKHVKPIDYNGLVYCFEVPSGFFVTERNGTFSFQGNSVNFDHQIVTTAAIAGPGDSGAVGVNPNNHLAGGLLFSGSNTITIFNPMTAVSNYANIVFNVGDKVPPLPANFASAPVSPLLLAAVGAGIVAYWIFNR